MTLTEFLLARIAEDEAVAQDALERGFGGWEDFADRGVNYEERTHIARHHPVRVLAECETKRRILNRHAPLDRTRIAPEIVCRCCNDWWPCPDVRDIAAVYSDHPDYQEEWRA